jgi:type IV pilus assembly protein PilN
MIRINLLGEKKDNRAAYALQILGFGGLVVLTLGASFVHHDSTYTDLELKKQQKVQLEGQLARLKKKTKKVDELEKKRKLLAEKLTTIAKLKARKQAPVRVLNDITSAIPDRAWLSSLDQRADDVIQFVGIALDNQTVSRMMVTLEESPQIRDVDLDYTKKFTRDGVNLQEFSLSAKLSDPLKRDQEKEAEDLAKAEERAAGVPKLGDLTIDNTKESKPEVNNADAEPGEGGGAEQEVAETEPPISAVGSNANPTEADAEKTQTSGEEASGPEKSE